MTVAALKRHLIEFEQIPEDRIAVATGNQRELDGIELFDPACRIEHIITVQALKEGWDCSFAYIFCSVSRIRSAVDVEQLLGRVLRMPYAQRRAEEALNKAYAFLSEPTFGDAARALVDKLVAMGFDEEEARKSIQRSQTEIDMDADLLPERDDLRPVFEYTIPAVPDLVLGLKNYEEVSVREIDGGSAEIVIVGSVAPELEKTITTSMSDEERKDFTNAVAEHRAAIQETQSPAERGDRFAVPRLMAHVQGALEFADIDVFMEHHEWTLQDHWWRPGEDEFAIRETARSFEIDLDGNRIAYQFTTEDEQLPLDVNIEGWTPQALVLWLDRQVRQPDITQGELLGWLSGVVNHLAVVRRIQIAALMRCKFILARKVREKIATIRRKERDGAYQRHLFSPASKPEISFDHAFEFEDGMYRDQRRYTGRWKPRRHFLGPDRVPAFDGAEDGEEFRCAQAIDSLPIARFWIRNVARHPASFWLPTAGGRFYPDFVAMLEDERLLVVEYKGAHIAEGTDTAEKRAVGELWQRMSGGKSVFVLAESAVDGVDARSQILAKLGR